MQRFLALVAVLVTTGILLPTQAQAFKPDIVYVLATDDTNGIRFSAKVRMDKGGRDERKVSVTYEGDRKNAEALKPNRQSFYETGAYSAPVKDCYSVTVKATNREGTSTREMRASLIGSDGCGNSRR